MLLHDDYFVRQKFAGPLEQQIAEMAAVLAACFKRLPSIVNAARELRTARTDLLKGFVVGVLDDLVVSVKLLLAGKAAASGNVARQAIEGLAMALLCSTDHELVILERPKQGDLRGRYWQMAMVPDERLIEGQRAVQQLGWNAETLRLPKDWITWLAAAQKRYSAVSHAGGLTIALRTNLNGAAAISFGGHFDPEKLDWYRVEMTHRILLGRELAEVIEYLVHTMAPRPAASTKG
ncbi:hypothetical protein DF112_23980 [Burkholderia stagnalis]|nr:hypothetical protein DF112_23980 [Burkholderia stagnalis]